MKKIEEQMIAAINAGKSKNLGNTEVRYNDENSVVVLLHGNMIAEKRKGEWKFSLAGWNTQVTRSRVDALCSTFGGPERRGVYTKAGQAYVKRYATLVRDPSGVDTRISDNEWF